MGIAVCFSTQAAVAAEPQCDQRDNVLRVLQQKYKEAPVALGVTHNGGLVEVLSSTGGGSWSIIVTTPQGMSCLVAAGEGWRTMEAKATDPEAMAEHVPLILAHGAAEWIMNHPEFRWCCSEHDCGPSPEGAVHWTPQGYSVDGLKGTLQEGERGFYRSSQVDRPWHCTIPGTQRLRCLFMPEGQG